MTIGMIEKPTSPHFIDLGGTSYTKNPSPSIVETGMGQHDLETWIRSATSLLDLRKGDAEDKRVAHPVLQCVRILIDFCELPALIERSSHSAPCLPMFSLSSTSLTSICSAAAI